MPKSTLFNIRVLRCPNCSATLPFEPNAERVTCEYCDAQIQVTRAKAAPAPPPVAAPASVQHTEYTAAPQTSGFGWVLFTLVLVFGIGGAVFGIIYNTFERTGMWDLLAASDSVPEIVSAQLGTSKDERKAATTAPKRSKRASKSKQADPPAKAEAETETDTSDEPAPAPEAATPGETKTKIVGKVAVRPKTPEPTGPVLSVPDAQKALEPKIRACLRTHGVHDILAYMGNSTVGAVKVLGDTRSRVDGLRAKIKGTALGKCMDAAGATVRVRAFKSNYLRFATVNDALPDPLAALPAKADLAEFNRIIATADAQVLACAKKHGEEGAKEVFYFVIDGPTGRATSVRASYRSKSFKRCAEPIYQKLQFPKVQQWTIKITKHLQM